MSGVTAIDTVARTIWGEARGEPPGGMACVAAVIMNRANHPRWWGHDPASVCLDPYQFSCWLPGDPNRAQLAAVTTDDPVFADALAIAAAAVNGVLPDPTGGADSYVDLAVSRPTWAVDRVPCYRFGRHSFYRLELPA